MKGGVSGERYSYDTFEMNHICSPIFRLSLILLLFAGILHQQPTNIQWLLLFGWSGGPLTASFLSLGDSHTSNHQHGILLLYFPAVKAHLE